MGWRYRRPSADDHVPQTGPVHDPLPRGLSLIITLTGKFMDGKAVGRAGEGAGWRNRTPLLGRSREGAAGVPGQGPRPGGGGANGQGKIDIKK